MQLWRLTSPKIRSLQAGDPGRADVSVQVQRLGKLECAFKGSQAEGAPSSSDLLF